MVKALQERVAILDYKPILEMEQNEIGWVNEKSAYYLSNSSRVYFSQNAEGTRRQIRKSFYGNAFIFTDEEKYGDEALIFID